MSPASQEDRHCQSVPPHLCTPETSAPTHPSSFPCNIQLLHQCHSSEQLSASKPAETDFLETVEIKSIQY